jgi:hypothetical protein
MDPPRAVRVVIIAGPPLRCARLGFLAPWSVGLVASLGASSAFGGQPASTAEGESSSASVSAPRLRVGVSGLTGGGFAGPPQGGAYRYGYPSSLSGVVGGAGISIDAGLQLGDETAFYLRGEASGWGAPPFASDAAGYLVAEWTPLWWLSLGSGLGYELMAPPATCNGMGPCGTNYPHWTGFSVPVLVVFNLPQVRLPKGDSRAALRLGIEGAGGLSVTTMAYDWHLALSLGVALM